MLTSRSITRPGPTPALAAAVVEVLLADLAMNAAAARVGNPLAELERLATDYRRVAPVVV